ncbi:MAG TPA: 2-amino-4-hydroxy-6-hydroxymethyldihydropteridine diphosphokinase [bacterium]|nr:2-amino-4-hydroxy-6-hydroxymethyldihydropteridine diphosphokinase [bacterium]
MDQYVFVALGSNIDDRLKYINSAIASISLLEGISVLKKSSLLETAPVGVSGQKDYLNQVLLLKTSIEPFSLLRKFKNIEVLLGRVARERWAEREIDIDIILHGDFILNDEVLTIPHKEILNRLFILKACVELKPDFFVKAYGKTLVKLYESLDDSVKQQELKVFTS